MKCPKCHHENPDDTLYCGKCAASLNPSEEAPVSQTETVQAIKEKLTTGSTFAGRYQIIEELGKGGMGKVFRSSPWNMCRVKTWEVSLKSQGN